MECSSTSRRSPTLIDLTHETDDIESVRSIISTIIDLTQEEETMTYAEETHVVDGIRVPTPDNDDESDDSRMLSYLRDCQERRFEFADKVESEASNNEKSGDEKSKPVLAYVSNDADDSNENDDDIDEKKIEENSSKRPIQTVMDEMYSEWLLQYSKAKIANATAAASNSQSLQCDDVNAPESKRMKLDLSESSSNDTIQPDIGLTSLTTPGSSSLSSLESFQHDDKYSSNLKGRLINRTSSQTIDGEYYPHNNRFFFPIPLFYRGQTCVDVHGYTESPIYLAWDYHNKWSSFGTVDEHDPDFPNSQDDRANKPIHCIVDEFSSMISVEVELFVIRRGNYIYHEMPKLVDDKMIREWEKLKTAGGSYRYVDDDTTRDYEQSHPCLSCGVFVAQVISKDCMHLTVCIQCHRKKMHSARQPYKCVKCNEISSYIGLPLD